MTRTKTLTPRQINAQRKRDGKPPLNFRLLRRIITKLESTPEAYNQGKWGERNSEAPCGTAACIAGWAAFLDGKLTHQQLRRNPKSAQRKGAKSLGLKISLYQTDEVYTLFTGDPSDTWPEPFSTRWINASGNRKREAKVAVAYLKHILATGEIN